ncbi:MAG: hypothetical protein GF403_00390 [Candidatus Coatesbacteria bacterium]|nr:hypothetical protein [Candidatus Coatesbacteria bacterium]
MRKIGLFVMIIAAVAMAAGNAISVPTEPLIVRAVGVTPEPADFDTDISVFIAMQREGNDGFGDTMTLYQNALTAMGVTDITTGEAPESGDTPGLDSFTGDLVIYTTSDDWWGPGPTAGDKASLMSFMDAGGYVLFCGQDYLWATSGPDGDFDPNYLGIAGASQDITSDTDNEEVTGSAGGFWDGMVVPISSDIFPSNGFYIDQITPGANSTALGELSSMSNQVCAIHTIDDGGIWESVFCAFDIVAADDTNEQAMLDAIFASWFPDDSSVIETSWGAIKVQ